MEFGINQLKRHRAATSRYDRLAVRREAIDLITVINERQRPAPTELALDLNAETPPCRTTSRRRGPDITGGSEAEREAWRRINHAARRREKSLDLAGLGLTELPSAVGDLSQLTALHLDQNRLTSLPDWISQLGNLSTLGLSENRFSSLPAQLSSLSKLEKLYLTDNEIGALPAWVGGLEVLRELHVAGNRLTDLPDSLARLSKLSKLTVSRNPLTSLIAHALIDNTDALLAFLRRRASEGVEQWQSKLVVVGQGGVGKTSLLKALTDVPHNAAEPMTHGMEIHQLLVDHPERTDVTMSLSAWDFGGQDIYHATHQFFMTDRSLVLLVWSARVGAEQCRLRYWLEIIKSRAPHAPVLVVATNTADHAADIDPQPLLADYPQIRGFLNVDCEKRDHGMTGLLEQIRRHAAQLPLMGARSARSWADVVARIRTESASAPYIDEARLWRIMADGGVVDADEQYELDLVLHDLGEVLHHGGDDDLADTVVLRPDWLNEMICRVLDCADVVDRGGMLTRSTVGSVWADLERPVRRYLLHMLDLYDVSYRVEDPGGDVVAIVVSRLPWAMPALPREWADIAQHVNARERRVVYQLPLLPPGIPTWFIARSRRFATDAHWRSGALLRDAEGTNLALVRADPATSRVELTVRGQVPDGFFAVLDDGLALTFGRYPGLRIQKLIPCPHRGISEDPCPTLFDQAMLLSRRAEGKKSAYCQIAEDGVDIDLLLGAAPATALLQTIGARIDRGFAEVIANQRELAQLHQYMFMRTTGLLQRAQAASCPSVFSLAPSHKRRPGKTVYELRLYCEEPGSWHRLPGTEGCYEVTELKEWLRRFAPHLQRVLELLKTAAPLVGPALGVAAAELDGQLKKDVTEMKTLLGEAPGHLKILDEPYHALTQGSQPEPSKHAFRDAEYRELEAMLVGLDPKRRWGQLNRTLTPEGVVLYLCRDHCDLYARKSIDL